MVKCSVPIRLWDFMLDYALETMNVAAASSRHSKGRTGLDMVTGITPDIAERLDFEFCSWVRHEPNAGTGQPELGR